MRKLALLAAAAALAGCATAEYSPTADGRGKFTISCPANEIGRCFAKARETCPRGYTVLSTHRPDNPLLPGVWQDRIEVQCEGGTRP